MQGLEGRETGGEWVKRMGRRKGGEWVERRGKRQEYGTDEVVRKLGSDAQVT